MTLSTKAMQLYVAVLDAGNFSEVARREGMSPSSVSRVVHQLESALGTQLLYRNTRAVVPTEAGLEYGNAFRQMLGKLHETTLRLQEREDGPSGLVRINAPVVFGQKHIAPWLAELTRLYPELRIELMQTDDFVDPLTDAVDLLFRIGPMPDSSFHARVVDRPVYHLAASPEYLERCGIPQKPADLYNHNCLVYKGVIGAQRSFFRKTGEETEVHAFGGPLMSNNAETLVNAALNGAGVVMMPDWQIGELLRKGDLTRLLPDYRVSTRQEEQIIAMLYPHTRFLPLNVRTVIDFFAVKYGTPAYWKYPLARD